MNKGYKDKRLPHGISIWGNDFDEFVAEIDEAREKYPDLNIILGIEAKILPDGGIDAPLNAFMQADIIGIATHSFDGTQEKLEQAWRNQFSI